MTCVWHACEDCLVADPARAVSVNVNELRLGSSIVGQGHDVPGWSVEATIRGMLLLCVWNWVILLQVLHLTPLQVAQHRGHAEVVTVLQSAGAMV